MAEEQREPVPRNDAGEKDTTLAFLSFARHCVITDAERYWFGHHVGGHGVDDFDFSMDVPADRSVADVMQAYRDAISASDEILAGVENVDQPVVVPVAETRHTVRWVVAHMTGETTRHAGHADILRELIDGTTGR